MGALDQVLIDEIISHQIDLLRLDAGVRQQVLDILQRMQKDLVAKLASEDLTAFGKQRTQALLKEASDVIDRYYAMSQGELDLTLQGVGHVTATHTADAITAAVTIEAHLPTENYLKTLVSNVLIQGAPSAEWWARQSLDTSFKFSNAVRQGLAQSETNKQIIARIIGSPSKGIPGIMDISRRNAEALVRSSIQAVANAARMETFRKNSDVTESVVWVATLDSKTCVLCAVRDLREYTLQGDPIGGSPPWDGGPGAIHWGCRCASVGKTKTLQELGFDLPEPPPGHRASMDGPVSADTNFESFLERKGAGFQDRVLGPGRAQLFRDGTISLEQLLDLRGNPLSLSELKAKYIK